ncbi:MAG: HU family DNA-binding protein [Candidatus Phytoplasma stylosanthis]|uniref:HU family DNA-binding protein n=1 Tax=Candidatus Phytoplasma stylosanthis TaxID=2798314 RepID=UPI0029396737|nr:HU family DNA-binding protein [Candidatus Phytoplasma stylosanthis]MDV3170834.1 HU family DNA-binding protein [Candidatus Phytoplasma stylosanthis]MDV3202556.1 HU family DNA-binding protein [Candidatus Phytoplasma stylosanthis]
MNKEKMNKEALIKALAQEGQVSVYEAEQFFKVLEKVLIKALHTNKEVSLGQQLGKFFLGSVKASFIPNWDCHYNQKTGQREMIMNGKRKVPAHTKVYFRPSTFLKQEVKGIKLNIK